MNNKPLFSGKIAFLLYDTYGFPLDLTQNILKEKNIEINIEEFEEELQKQKNKSKESWIGTGDSKYDKIYFDIKNKILPTNFVGYQQNTTKAKILSLIKNKEEVQEVNNGDEFEFFVDTTSFYGESGGQVGDTGLGIQVNENGVIPLPFSIIEIIDVKKIFSNYYLHKGKLESGKIKVGDYVNLSINQERRNKITANHSATHLLQYAIKTILGNNISQRGAYYDEYGLRFDFNYGKQIEKDILISIENKVNEIIFQNTDVIIKTMNLEEAKKNNAIALFNEKYEDKVRVIFIGEDKNNEIKNFKTDNSINNVFENLNLLNNSSIKKYLSIELCGGTHIKKTGEIGLFKITSEESISSGIRRIEAKTGIEALKYINTFQKTIEEIDSIFQIGTKNLLEKIININEENKKIKKELNDIKKSNLSKTKFETEIYKNINIYYSNFTDDNNNIKQFITNLIINSYNKQSIILSYNEMNNKITINLAISKDLNNKLSANKIIKELIEFGGGQDWISSGTLKNKKDIKMIIEELKKILDKYYE